MQTATIPRELLDVLREHEDRFWTAQAIWTCLQERFPTAVQEIQQTCDPRAGACQDPVAAVASHLRSVPECVHRQWLHGAEPSASARPSGAKRVEIFRWRGEHDRCL